MGRSEVTFIFHGWLRELLKKRFRTAASFVHRLERRASVKDVVESLGIPHPLIENLTVKGDETGFSYILADGDQVEIFPLMPSVNPLVGTLLRPVPLEDFSFVADVNVGKLALYLRMLGFDTASGTDMRDSGIAEISRTENRILLTRDLSLLKRKIVMHGYLVREQDPEKQLVEVVSLYDLESRIKPLSRCIPCNGILVPVGKDIILDRLEPLTKKYYDSFHTCSDCGRIYWPGSHQKRILAFVDRVIASVRSDHPQWS